MPADDTNGPGGRTALSGFLTNADDSLRVVHGDQRPQPPQPARFVGRTAISEHEWSDDDEADERYADEPAQDAAERYEPEEAYEPEDAYEAEAAEDVDWRAWPEADRGPGARGLLAAALILLAGAVGVATIGWNLTHPKTGVLPVAESHTSESADAPRQVEIAAAAPSPPTPATERAAPSTVETAAPVAETAPAPRAPAHTARHPPEAETAQAESRASDRHAKAKATSKLAAQTPPKGGKTVAKKTSTKVLTAKAAPPRGKTALDCAHPQTVGRHMACDPQIADANHQVGEAYLAAVAAGAPADQLNSEQKDWLSVRDEAAKRSAADLAAAYKARVDALDRQRNQALNEPPH